MTRTMYGDLEVLTAPPTMRREALDLVLQDIPAERRAAHIDNLLAGVAAGQIDLDGLLLAQHDSQIVGAMWAYLQPGHVASLWPPVSRGSQAEAAADALLRETNAWLTRASVRLVQSLLAPDAFPQTAQLERHGFTHMADLLYMVSLAGQFPARPPASPLQFTPSAATNPARLAEIVERSYTGTLDCPQLNGVRDIEDVLAGYRACGTFDSARWLIVSRDETDVGCLLLTDHPAEDQWEIVYAGLIPAARGKHYGLAMSRHAQWLAHSAGRARLVLAVDASNAPAVKMYESAGFVIWDRRRALLQIFPRGGVVTRAPLVDELGAGAEKSSAKSQ